MITINEMIKMTDAELDAAHANYTQAIADAKKTSAEKSAMSEEELERYLTHITELKLCAVKLDRKNRSKVHARQAERQTALQNTVNIDGVIVGRPW